LRARNHKTPQKTFLFRNYQFSAGLAAFSKDMLLGVRGSWASNLP